LFAIRRESERNVELLLEFICWTTVHGTEIPQRIKQLEIVMKSQKTLIDINEAMTGSKASRVLSLSRVLASLRPVFPSLQSLRVDNADNQATFFIEGKSRVEEGNGRALFHHEGTVSAVPPCVFLRPQSF